MRMFRRLIAPAACALLLAACGNTDGKKNDNNGADPECTSNADCNGGICDLATQTCQGGNNGTNNGSNNGSNNGTKNGTNNGSNNGTNNGAMCGNGVVDEGETCDGDCPSNCDDGDACTIDTLEGLVTSCTAACAYETVTACTNGDGCCPTGCDGTNDDDCDAICGNGVLDIGENCDFGIAGGPGTCPINPGDCDDGNACTLNAVTGNAGECTAQCQAEPIVVCVNGDGCCPGACDSSNDTDCQPKPGQRCTDNTDCPDSAQSPGFCMTEADWNWTDGFCVAGCALDADCPMGSHCNGAVCVPDCGSNDDCRAGYVCTDHWGTGRNTCAPAPGSGQAPGGVCTQASDCLGALFGATCLTDGFPDGWCTAGCLVDSHCPADSHCATFSNGSQACVPNCAADTDCRSGYECFGWFGDIMNTCGPVANGAGQVGDACSALQDCAGGQDGLCLTDQDWKDGYCSQSCSAADPCPTGTHCGYLDPVSLRGICVDDCTDASQCRNDYGCVDADDDQTTECAPSGIGSGVVGDACTGVYECSGGTDAFCVREESGFRSGYCSVVCTNGAAICPAGTHCEIVNTNTNFAMCLDDCASDADCRPDGYQCYDWAGQGATTECAPSGTGAAGIGDECTGTWDCAGGEGAFCFRDEDGWPDGYCLDDGCTSDADCGAGAHCGFISTDTGQGVCLDSCATDVDCRAEYGCYDYDRDAKDECLPVGDNGVGQGCSNFWDCGGRRNAVCVSDPVDYPGGYCLLDCTPGTGDQCPVGSVCLGPFQGGASFCFDACATNSECRPGYDCQDITFTGQNVCF